MVILYHLSSFGKCDWSSVRPIVPFRQYWTKLLYRLRIWDRFEQLACNLIKFMACRRLLINRLDKGFIHALQIHKLVGVMLKEGAVNKLLAWRPFIWFCSKHQLYHLPNVIWVVIWNPGVDSPANTLEELVHILAVKWRFQRQHFVDDAPQRPDITLKAIRFVFPHFRWCIIWRSCLRVIKALVRCDFWHIHVAQFRLEQKTRSFWCFSGYDLLVAPPLIDAIIVFNFLFSVFFWVFEQENVCWFYIPMHDTQLVHRSEAVNSFNKNTPYLTLSKMNLHSFTF